MTSRVPLSADRRRLGTRSTFTAKGGALALIRSRPSGEASNRLRTKGFELTSSRARRRFSRTVAATALVVVSLLTGAHAATALGWSPVVNCSGGGQLSGRSYQVTFSNAGGNTYADNGCAGGASTSIQLYYQAYPGGPYYWTPTKLVQGSQVALTQSGTWNGRHKAYNGSGVLVGSTNS